MSFPRLPGLYCARSSYREWVAAVTDEVVHGALELAQAGAEVAATGCSLERIAGMEIIHGVSDDTERRR
jgi:hypothetical protein